MVLSDISILSQRDISLQHPAPKKCLNCWTRKYSQFYIQNYCIFRPRYCKFKNFREKRLKTYLWCLKFPTRAWFTYFSKQQNHFAISRGFYFHETSPIRLFMYLFIKGGFIRYLWYWRNICETLEAVFSAVSCLKGVEYFSVRQMMKKVKMFYAGGWDHRLK